MLRADLIAQAQIAVGDHLWIEKIAVQSLPALDSATIAARGDAVAYLLQAVVLPAERGGGAGAALLQHALAWLRREGFAGCGLHYLTGNPSGPPFWTRHGFRAAEYHLRRIVDPRIAWSAR